MVVEHFRNEGIQFRFTGVFERGRMAPEGLRYVSSWVDEKLEHCFQLMETSDVSYLNE